MVSLLHYFSEVYMFVNVDLITRAFLNDNYSIVSILIKLTISPNGIIDTGNKI